MLVLRTIEVDEKVCRRCLRGWVSKVENPKVCALCKSPYWNKDRLRTGEHGAVNKWGFNEWELDKWYELPIFETPDGKPDTVKNETRWRSLAQFARRRGLQLHFDGNKGRMYAKLFK